MAVSIAAAVREIKKHLNDHITPDDILNACLEAGHEWRERTLQCVASLGVVCRVTSTIVPAQCLRLVARRPRPERSSSMPVNRSAAKRFRQVATVTRCTPSLSAISRFSQSSAASKIIRARDTRRAAAERLRAHWRNIFRSASLKVI